MAGHIVFSRNEIKYLIDTVTTHRLRKTLRQNIPLHSFTKGKLSTFVTTIYFDTQDFSFFKRAQNDPRNNIKLRAKEYYYFNPELIEHACSLDQLFDYSPKLYLEIKTHSGDQTNKYRLQCHKTELAELLTTGILSKSLQALNPDSGQTSGFLEHYATMRRITNNTPLEPVALVNYQRNAFQDEQSSLRVSLDQDIAYYRASWPLVLKTPALTREALSTPIAQETSTILEIKHTGELPVWIKSITDQLLLAPISKFCLCCEAAQSLRSIR